MRYVVAVVVVTFYILYEQMYNDWHFTHAIVAEVSRLLRLAGL
jgi:hypothetical protein